MSAGLVSLAALRTARMLKENAPPQHIDAFVAQMTLVARQHGDPCRAVFWRDVAALVRREPPRLACGDHRRQSGGVRG
jgi:hypothetical protein